MARLCVTGNVSEETWGGWEGDMKDGVGREEGGWVGDEKGRWQGEVGGGWRWE